MVVEHSRSVETDLFDEQQLVEASLGIQSGGQGRGWGQGRGRVGSQHWVATSGGRVAVLHAVAGVGAHGLICVDPAGHDSGVGVVTRAAVAVRAAAQRGEGRLGHRAVLLRLLDGEQAARLLAPAFQLLQQTGLKWCCAASGGKSWNATGPANHRSHQNRHNTTLGWATSSLHLKADFV